MLLTIILLISVSLMTVYTKLFRQSLTKITWLSGNINKESDSLFKIDYNAHSPLVSVIIPAYNEEENIEKCLRAVFNSITMPKSAIEVWVVDDQSTDKTLTIAQSLQPEYMLKVVSGKPRPENKKWVGKSWACTQGAEQARGEFLLFVDADVILKKGVIEIALQEAQSKKVDLLSLFPEVICDGWAEWLVQPIVFNHLQIVLDFQEINDPQSEVAGANGMFMLFRRSAYEQIGGFHQVADQVVDDMALAKLIKTNGLKLFYLSAPELISVRMYPSWKALWEGWTKNFYTAMGRQKNIALLAVLILIFIYPIPWVGLAICIEKILTDSWHPIDYLSITFAIVAIVLQYDLRRMREKYWQTPRRYWWSSGVGGFVLALIILGSVIKTETGWGWTWRGRSL